MKSDLMTAAGAASLVGAALSGEMAWLATRDLGVICGAAGQSHCPWLLAAAGLLTLGLALLAKGRRGETPAA